MKKLLLATMALLCSLTGEADNGFAIDDFTIAANGEATIQIKMNNDVTFSGFQFDLELPEGVSIKRNDQNKLIMAATNRLKVDDGFGEYTPTHTVECSLQPSGAYRVMVYSGSSASIQGTSGTAVLRTQLVASDQVATGNFTPKFTNIVMSQADETQYKPADCSYNCTVTLSTTVTTLGYASFSWPKALDFTNSGLTAYIVTSCTTNSMRLEPVTKVPANTGLILKGTAGSENTYPLQTTEETPDDVTENMLASNTAGAYTVETNNVYVLSNLDNGKPGFYLAAQGLSIPQYKSYLVLSENPTRKGLVFDEADNTDDPVVIDDPDEDDGTATGVSAALMNNERRIVNNVYDLQGRRVAQPSKGVYVAHGKKRFVK